MPWPPGEGSQEAQAPTVGCVFFSELGGCGKKLLTLLLTSLRRLTKMFRKATCVAWGNGSDTDVRNFKDD